MKGKLIVIMGIDGSGKTTLVGNLEECGCDVDNWKCMSVFDNSVFTKELEEVAKRQGKTRRECFSKDLRSIIWRADLINNVYQYVVPELENGNTVILDRYTLCNKVYSNLRNMGLEHMDRMLDILPKPDLGIYLDVNIDTALKRISERNAIERAPYERKDGLVQIKGIYEELMPQEDYPIVRINANLSKREVTKETLDNIIKLVNKEKVKEIDER